MKLNSSPKEIRARCYKDCGKTVLVHDYSIPQQDWWKLPRDHPMINGHPAKRITITEEDCEKRFKESCRRVFPNHRGRPGTDTRRTTWKKFGEHHGKQWYSVGAGKECKRDLHRAERRMWKIYAREFSGLTARECYHVYNSSHDVKDKRYSQNYSTVDWRND